MPAGKGFKGRRKGPGPAHLTIINAGPFKKESKRLGKKYTIIITDTGFIEIVFGPNQSIRNNLAIIKLIKDVLDIR